MSHGLLTTVVTQSTFGPSAIGNKSCPKMLGSPLTDTVNKSFSQQVPIKRLEELRDMRSAKSEHAVFLF
uniref:Uncharacterized protein n=1 Tax=Tanacetum cinerariifolium TaxID=118510 RepID=A0A6L2MU18_TANCI|nr:hypothetical protein [Tanacetum cinerariifolium]